MAMQLLRFVLFVAFVVLAAANTSGGLIGKWALMGKRAGLNNNAAEADDACGCKNDKNGPVCHPSKLDYIADCAAQAECNGEAHNYVACASLRTVSWRHDCSCRHSWDPVCDWNGDFVAPNWECSKCLKLKATSRCKETNFKTPEIKQRDCQCPKEFRQDTQEPVCSTVTGSWLALDSCTAFCRGFKSFLPCSKMPNRNALVPATGLEDKPIKQQTCSMVGAKVGDIAGKLGCQKVMQTCRAVHRDKMSPGLDGWESSLTVLPSCFSGEAKDCYGAATDWALKDEECLAVLSQDGRVTDGTEECSGATARRLFGAAVSRVCGEEVRDGEPFGFWSISSN